MSRRLTLLARVALRSLAARGSYPRGTAWTTHAELVRAGLVRVNELAEPEATDAGRRKAEARRD